MQASFAWSNAPALPAAFVCRRKRCLSCRAERLGQIWLDVAHKLDALRATPATDEHKKAG
jgi:hypothetical protein